MTRLLPLLFYGPRRSRGPLKRRKKRLLFSYLDRKSLVNKGFIMKQKYFALVRIKSELSISRARRESQMCF